MEACNKVIIIISLFQQFYC